MNRAAAILIAGGILVVLGSFSDWGACAQEPCDPELLGLMHLYERSGIDMGWGILTAALGAAALLLGINTLRSHRRRPLFEGLAAVGIFLAVGVHLYLETYGGPANRLIGPPHIGVYMTVMGAVVVLGASLFLPRAGPGGDPRWRE